MTYTPRAQDFDCGDGVPDLPLLTVDPGGPGNHPRPPIEPTPATPPAPTPPVGATPAILALTIGGQLALLLAVLAGGNAVVGAIGGLALLVCALTLIGVRRLRTILFDRP